MSQLGHYVNRRNVQAAVSQVWPIFFGGNRLTRSRRRFFDVSGDNIRLC